MLLAAMLLLTNRVKNTLNVRRVEHNRSPAEDPRYLLVVTRSNDDVDGAIRRVRSAAATKPAKLYNTERSAGFAELELAYMITNRIYDDN